MKRTKFKVAGNANVEIRAYLREKCSDLHEPNTKMIVGNAYFCAICLLLNRFLRIVQKRSAMFETPTLL